MAADLDAKIRVHAYHLWEQAGRPEGQEQAFWFRAVSEMTEKAMTAAPARKQRKPRKVAAKAA